MLMSSWNYINFSFSLFSDELRIDMAICASVQDGEVRISQLVKNYDSIFEDKFLPIIIAAVCSCQCRLLLRYLSLSWYGEMFVQAFKLMLFPSQISFYCFVNISVEIAPLFERNELKCSRNAENSSTKDTALSWKSNQINLYCKKWPVYLIYN